MIKNKKFTYIRIDETEQYIHTSGITFEEFYNGIADKPQNLLLKSVAYSEDYYYCSKLKKI